MSRDSITDKTFVAIREATHGGCRTTVTMTVDNRHVTDKDLLCLQYADELLEVTKDIINNYDKEYSYLLGESIKKAKEVIAIIEGDYKE